MIVAVAIAGAACEVALSHFAAPRTSLLVLGFLVGATTYSLYTLAVSLANDDSAPHDLVFISVGLLFIYCVAAIAGPAVASVLMKHFGPQTLFIQNAYVHPDRRRPRPLGASGEAPANRKAGGVAATSRITGSNRGLDATFSGRKSSDATRHKRLSDTLHVCRTPMRPCAIFALAG